MAKKTNIADLIIQANRGDVKAQESLALLFELGLEGTADMVEAKKYWTMAAKHGSDVARKSLAQIIRYGLDGSPPSPEHGEKLMKIVSPVSAKERIQMLGDKPKILVVEDSKVYRAQLTSILEEQSYEIDVAENGQVALDILKERSFDLIITDMEMPVMNGVQLVRSFRKDYDKYDTPILVLTSNSNRKVVEVMKDLGISAWLVKPPKQDALEDLCRKILKKRRAI